MNRIDEIQMMNIVGGQNETAINIGGAACGAMVAGGFIPVLWWAASALIFGPTCLFVTAVGFLG